MGVVMFQVAVSLDGYLAGADQSLEHPLGIGGEDLHRWMVDLDVWRRMHGMEGGEVNASTAVIEEGLSRVGAFVMGRNMFGGGPGPWRDDPPWRGWWGDEPPYHAPVFVQTHHPRAVLEMEGGTTFTFVTEGFASALEQARTAAGDRDVQIAGGAHTIQQYLAAGLVERTPPVSGTCSRLRGASSSSRKRTTAWRTSSRSIRVASQMSCPP